MKTDQLSAQEVRTKKVPGYYCDGRGLYLQVSDAGTKSWVFRFTLDGRTRDMGLGPYPTFTLKEARERARTYRQLLADGIDPIEDRRRRRDEARADTAGNTLFKDAAQQYIEVHAPGWRNPKSPQQWRNTLKAYAYPTLAMRPVSAIDAALINDALTPIWLDKTETARRVRQRINKICQWIRDGKPLSNKSAKDKEHHPAMPFADVPEFVSELQANESISARALEFTVITVARTGDTIKARWPDIDLEMGVWAIPEHKTGKFFEIPLPKRAIKILKDIPRERGNDHVFVGAKRGSGLSNAAMAELLKGMHKARAKSGLPPWTDKDTGRLAVPHGFRSSFRDWAGDHTNFPRELIETAMSHKIKDKVEAAYRRTAALEKRRKLMESWSGYCASPKPEGKVVPMRGAA